MNAEGEKLVHYMCTHAITGLSPSNFLILPRMQAIGFYLLLPFLYFFSILPMGVLRGISNVLRFFLQTVAGYRKAVVMQNLRNAYPGKSEEEIHRIADGFYVYLCDTLMETIKSFTISDAQLARWCSIQNFDLVQEEIDKGRNVMFVLGHYGNWEWGGGALAKRTPFPLKAAYKPLSNPYFEKLMFKSRSRLSIYLIPKRKILSHLQDHSGEQTLLVLIADQSPNPKEHFWVQFLRQDTAVVTGMEKIARQYDYVVIYSTIRQVRRNRYEIHFEKLTDDPRSMEPVELTQRFMQLLEADIDRDPSPYLWSHRRWKLRKPTA